MVHAASWVDLDPIGGAQYDLPDPIKHGHGAGHPYYIRDDAEIAALVAVIDSIDGPIRWAPDVCGTLVGDSKYNRSGRAFRCDPSLPFGTIIAGEVAPVA